MPAGSRGAAEAAGVLRAAEGQSLWENPVRIYLQDIRKISAFSRERVSSFFDSGSVEMTDKDGGQR